jgi:hypothetical protein
VALLTTFAVINDASSRRWDRWTAFPIQDAVGASSAVAHPWTCTPIATQVKTNTSPARPKAVGVRQPRNGARIINDNSDVYDRDGPKVNSDILHRHSAPCFASAIPR